jgi:serine/threonine protein kinase
VAELSPGVTLSQYRIVSKIGAGGMGEVYRAQDTELGRPVALKFLSGEVAAHQSRVKRFIQEAQAASALNHPNILTVHQIGRQDDAIFIATEFVDGFTLRQYMRQPLKLTAVLDIATQIASALVAAHAAGIVHRDIKPENIMVRKDGIVKVLDFGLAKLTEVQDSSSEATTMALVNTEPGSVLGTPAYMSPEQATGREVDARSDIWSFGVVLYEMIAAHQPFDGTSKSHIIVAILDREPTPITHFAPEVPEALELVITEALAKDVEERCQTAKEMLGKLRRLKQRLESAAMAPSNVELKLSAPPQSSVARKEATLHEAARSTAPAADTAHTQALSSLPLLAGPRKKFVFAAVVIAIVVSAISFALFKLFTQPTALLICFEDKSSRIYRQTERVLLKVHWQCQSYMFDQNVDLGDFCELLDREIELVAKELGAGDGVDILRLVQQQCRVVNEQLKLTVILSGFSGGSYQYSNGVSVFFPWSREGYEVSRKNYESLWYSSDLGRDEAPWTRFLTTYLNDVSLRKLEDVVEQTGAGSRFRYPSGVKFSEGTVTNLSGRSSQRTKIAGHEGTKIAGHEGTKLAGGGSSAFFNSLQLFKNIESRWDISGFTKKPDEAQLADD